MRKLIVSELVSLDGFFAGPNGEIDWHRVDDEHNADSEEFLSSIDALIFGRITYELMASYWTTATGAIAVKMNKLPKIVFSRTLENVEWQFSRLAKGNPVEEIASLKSQSGKDLAILGSGNLASYLMNARLIDEFHITIVPVVLGSGIPLFKNIHERANLILLNSRTSNTSGNVQLVYKTTRQNQ
jgi:dihydrofolate reductase